jgi:hypothetical protein
MRTIPLASLVVAGLFLVPSEGRANIIDIRCSADSLSPDQARLRIEWARKCGLLNYRLPEERQDYGAGLRDYKEDTGVVKHWVSGPEYDFRINDAKTNSLYYFTINTWEYEDPSGTPTWQYTNWGRNISNLRPRPIYPTFGTTESAMTGQQLWPSPEVLTNSATPNCALYTNSNGTGLASTWYVNGYCTSSCYTPEQTLSFSGGEDTILNAFNNLRMDLVTLSEESTFDNIVLADNKVKSYTTELRDNTHPILVIVTASGRQLRVTVDHPVIQGEGRIVEASTLQVGDSLVLATGRVDPIVSIDKVAHVGKVYNVQPVTTDPVSNLLVAGGIVVGSSRFQNDAVEYLNRIILSKGIPPEVIPH